MFNNIGFDIFIGLIFIFLLYGLLASIVVEMFATTIGLRARNLREAVDRMINDEDEKEKSFRIRLWDSLKLIKNPKNPRITNFYNHPEIKYLGGTGIFKIPSQFKSVSFSKTLLNLLAEIGYKKLHDGNTMMENQHEGDIKDIPVRAITRERIETALRGIITDHGDIRNKITHHLSKNEIKVAEQLRNQKDMIVLDEETAKYVFSLWYESHGDLIKFKLQLETWFDRTMEQCLEWYKRKIQVVLLVLGFFMAWIFNADTFRIVLILSDDKDAREKLVTMASAYSQNKAINEADTPGKKNNRILETLDVSEAKLKTDIAEAKSILGLGSWPPNKVTVSIDSITKKKIYTPAIDSSGLSEDDMGILEGEIHFVPATIWKFKINTKKWGFFFNLLCSHFWGYLITALAISLGAPFWFDLLNKVMRLRTAVKQPLDTTKGDDSIVSPLNRIG